MDTAAKPDISTAHRRELGESTPGDRTRSPPRIDNDQREKNSETVKTTVLQRMRQHAIAIIGASIAAVILIAIGIIWWLHARQYESTDDAFIDARTVTISPQISGDIRDVPVNDNQVVKAGTILVQIDDSIYRAQRAQSAAQVDQAKANIANLDAQLDAQQARIDQAKNQETQTRAALTFAQQEFDRAAELAKTGNGTVQQAQQTQSNLKQAQANVEGAAANTVAAIKQLAILQAQRSAAVAQLENAQAQVDLADTNLSYTIIKAPTDGRVTKLTAAKGAYVAPGQAVMMFVPNAIWVTANFKETQLDHIRVGQPVDISIDALGGRSFHGHVDSIQAGSGTVFSLLPAENATGNFVKVVQRVPVKIVFDQMPDVELGPGMSVVPAVKVQ